MRLVRIALAGAALCALAWLGAPRGRAGPAQDASTVLAASNPSSLHVDAAAALRSATSDGSAEHPFASIAQALQQAGAGAEIHVAAGEYRERLAILRPVKLVGAGAARTRLVAPSANGTAIAMLGAAQLTMAGMAIEGGEIGLELANHTASLVDVALRGQLLGAVVVRGGALTFEGGEILDVGEGRTGIGVEVARGSLQIRRTVVRRAGRRAFAVRSAEATLTDVDVQGSALFALQATDGADVTIRGGRFAGNGGAALYAGDARLHILDARVERNELGIVGFRGARIIVENSQVVDHLIAGIAVTDASLTVQRSFLARGGSDAAVSVVNSRSAVLEENSIVDPGFVGVQILQSEGTLRGNEIRGARADRQRDFGDGIYALRSELVLLGNVLRANAGSGISLSSSTARLSRNDLLANGRSGAVLLERSRLDAEDNLFDRNVTAGLEVTERSVARLRGNRFVQLDRAPIQDWCEDAARRGRAELGSGNTFVGIANRTSCL